MCKLPALREVGFRANRRFLADMRAHAHVEDHIRRLKASGLERFPFCDLEANRAWMPTVCFAADLVRWFQLLCLTGALAVAEPKALRWGCGTPRPASFAEPAQRRAHPDGRPTTGDLLAAAYRRIALIT